MLVSTPGQNARSPDRRDGAGLLGPSAQAGDALVDSQCCVPLPKRQGLGRRGLLWGLGGAGLSAACLGRFAVAVEAPGRLPADPARLLAPDTAPPHRLPQAVLPVQDHAEWATFKQRFLAPDGRVIDTHNGGISHSEGQGWGLFLSVVFDDPAAFNLILGWTRRALRRPGDHLHAWRYRPGAPDPVSDPNNATDGDLYIAAAMARAARRWDRPELEAAAAEVARDVLRLLVRRVGERTVLLPGVEGFEKADHVVLNPSYYAFPVLGDLAAVAPSPVWARLRDDGLALITQGRFGHWGLPPDWLRLDRRTGRLAPASAWPARFSYDAIRVPLNLAWAGVTPPELQAAFVRYWAGARGGVPAWVDLHTGDVAAYPAPPGIRAVAHFAAEQQGLHLPMAHVSVKDAADYYSAVLIVLSRVARAESRLPI